MKKELRTACHDNELSLEAYRFQGVIQPFPNHFHEHYVIGYMENGERALSCGNSEFLLKKGHLLLLNPGDSHACTQTGSEPLDYWGLNIPQPVMLDLIEEITGQRALPLFSPNVLADTELSCCFRSLHQAVMNGSKEFEKEENLLLLAARLTERCSNTSGIEIPGYPREVELSCDFIRSHYAEHICLEQICRFAGLSKSTLLRAFTKAKGITPYRYLLSVRIAKAQKLLEQGVTPAAAAIQTGFSDQSHFTNTFHTFIGLVPGMYRDIFEKVSEKK